LRDAASKVYTVLGSVAVYSPLRGRTGVLDDAPIARIAGPSLETGTAIAVFGPVGH
jgi:hypothetical protein